LQTLKPKTAFEGKKEARHEIWFGNQQEIGMNGMHNNRFLSKTMKIEGWPFDP